LYFFISVFR